MQMCRRNASCACLVIQAAAAYDVLDHQRRRNLPCHKGEKAPEPQIGTVPSPIHFPVCDSRIPAPLQPLDPVGRIKFAVRPLVRRILLCADP